MTIYGRRRGDIHGTVKDGPHRHRIIPDLHYDHPGYFKVVASLLFIHIGLAADSLLDGPGNSPVFRVLREAIGGQLWILAVLHLLIAVLTILGLYWRGHFNLLRFGCGLSLILFNVIAACFAAAALKYNLSYYSTLASVTLSLSSLAAMKEPPIQIAKR